ncbi:hypothetical protein PGB90_000322 [Kerria lacca]
MTIKNLSTKKTKTDVTLQLTGSQIILSPRPLPVTHLSWNIHYGTYPMRRSISALGFQQKNDEHINVIDRPMSADNIHRTNKINFSNDFCTSTSNISPSNEIFGETRQLSENIFENIINGYSENIFCYEKSTSENEMEKYNNLKPGLSSKPPLPPVIAETKSNSASNGNNNDLNKSKEIAMNMKAIAEQEAFDEIIALKFQRWFPNTSITVSNESSSEDESNDLKLLSYKQQKFQTTEYRCEILESNKKVLTFDKRKNRVGFGNNRMKNKKLNGKLKKNMHLNQQSSTESVDIRFEGTHSQIESKKASNETENETVKIESTDKLNMAKDSKYDNIEEFENNDRILGSLKKQDLRILQKKQNFKIDKNQEDNNVNLKKTVNKLEKQETNELQSKYHKNTLQKKSNSFNATVSPSKKHKNISFLEDEKVKKKENILELYSENKYSSNYDMENRNTTKIESSNIFENRKENPNIIRNNAESPQQLAGSQIEDVISWMGIHHSITPTNKQTIETPQSNSMYEEIVDILKDIENEDIQDNFSDHSKMYEISKKGLELTSPARAIWTLLEEANKNNVTDNTDSNQFVTENIRSQDENTNNGSKPSSTKECKNWNRLSDLLRYSNAELAQKIMALQLLLEERETTLKNLQSNYKANEQTYQQQKQELEYSINKRQRLIEQLQLEKKVSSEKLENTLKEMEKKQSIAIQTLEEKHKIELKKSIEKQAAADKLEREKWMETKTQKIKELAIKGLEPELNRMAVTHQEEISEIRKFHKRQLEELEEALNRRMAVQKEKLDAEKEKSLAIEREIARQKLEDEIGELEKRYQDQRKRLLAEVHVERENMERANEATLAIKEKENERKWELKSLEMKQKIESLQNQHQKELQKLYQNLETEKQIWIKNETMQFMEKENKIREQCKKERDKHIELVIQKLENENTERERTAEQKLRNTKRKNDRLMAEQGEMQNMAKSELSTRIHILQSELNQAQLTYESQIKLLKSENERELLAVYNRVREMIEKKEETIDKLKKEKEAALQQCYQLEKFLDLKRNDRSSFG